MTEISPVRTQAPILPPVGKSTRRPGTNPTATHQTDSVSLSGPTSRKDVMALVLEKTFSQIKKTGGHGETHSLYNGLSIKDLQRLESLVQNAKADLGLPPGKLALCLVGGILGIALGTGAAVALAKLAGWNTLVSPTAVGVAFAFSAAIGLFFGIWPARRASLLDPIVALRYE